MDGHISITEVGNFINSQKKGIVSGMVSTPVSILYQV